MEYLVQCAGYALILFFVWQLITQKIGEDLIAIYVIALIVGLAMVLGTDADVLGDIGRFLDNAGIPKS